MQDRRGLILVFFYATYVFVPKSKFVVSVHPREYLKEFFPVLLIRHFQYILVSFVHCIHPFILNPLLAK